MTEKLRPMVTLAFDCPAVSDPTDLVNAIGARMREYQRLDMKTHHHVMYQLHAMLLYAVHAMDKQVPMPAARVANPNNVHIPTLELKLNENRDRDG